MSDKRSNSFSVHPAAQIVPILLICAVVFALPIFLNNDFLLNKVARYLVYLPIAGDKGSEQR